MIAQVRRDLAYAARTLRRRPGLTSGVVLTLGLGVFGATALARAVVETAFLTPPGAAVDGLYAATRVQNDDTTTSQLTLGRILALQREKPETLEAVAIDAGTWQVTLGHDDREGRFPVGFVDGYYASSLRLGLQAGRWIGPDDNRLGSNVVVLGDQLRQRWFAGRLDETIGSSLDLNGRPFTVIGIADPEFRGLAPAISTPIAWVPLTTREALSPEPAASVLGIIKPKAGSSVPELVARIGSIPQMAAGRVRPGVTPLAGALRDRASMNRAMLLAAMVVVLWLTCCASVANLLLARAAERRTEIAVRLSLGASRRQIDRLFLSEGLILSTLAATLGVLFTWAVWWVWRSRGAGLPGADYSSTAGWIVWLLPSVATTWVSTLAVAVGTGRVLARAAPASLASGSGTVAGSRSLGRVRMALVAFQVAVGLQAALGAGLYMERLNQVRRDAPVPTEDIFDSHLLATAQVDFKTAGYDAERAARFMHRAIDELRRLPGVQNAAVATALPTSEPGDRGYARVRPADAGLDGDHTRAAAWLSLVRIAASPSFFDAAGIRLIDGTTFPEPSGSIVAPVAILSQSAAGALWPGRSAIGRRLILPRPNLEARRLDYEQLTVVGITADPVRRSSTSPIWADRVLFVPFDAASLAPLEGIPPVFVITRSSDPAAQLEPMRRTVRALDPVLALVSASTRDDHEQKRVAALNRVDAAMVAVSFVAVAVSIVSIYALMSFLASARRRELAIRVALGAAPVSIGGLLVRQAIRIVLVGLLPGVLVASIVSRVLQANVVHFMPNNVTTWSGAIVAVLACGVAASFLPARRAARESPAESLRHL
jgi:predicted permease